MDIIEQELRKVFDARVRDVPSSGDGSPIGRRASVDRRIARHRQRRIATVVIALVLVASGGVAAASVRHGPDERSTSVPPLGRVPTPTITQPIRCDGSSAEPVLRTLLAALASGQHIDVATYFVTPRSFNLWWDPTLPSGHTISYELINGGPANLNVLGAHLDALSRRHMHLTVSTFQAGGFTSTNYNGSPGGGGFFTYDLQAGPSGKPQTYMRPGGEGLVDCASGKLKALVVDEW